MSSTTDRTTRTPQEARQAETGRRTFVVLTVSTLIAAAIAVGAYFYVFAEDDAQLRGDLPAATSVDEAPPASAPTLNESANEAAATSEPASGSAGSLEPAPAAPNAAAPAQ
ncbi:hypothetical protein [Acuticoccus yangtzensis]|uniref:hypothetical protein n=1 Tax=Acuticoccus yangtzensis TaxID=1443441 RepID=UPI0011151416|nr:hypothetical protein [Acuticoccus yangtzensis]